MSYLKKTNADLYLLQETHLVGEKNIIQWTKEWGGKVWCSQGESNSRGVAILRHPRSNIIVDNVESDQEGRIICCKLNDEDRLLTLCNVYAPNSDDPHFFLKVTEMIESVQGTECTIMGGDFNMVMNPEQDRLGSLVNHHKSCDILKEYITRVNMQDVWRVRNPQKRDFTWHRTGRGSITSMSRIDFFLISDSYSDRVVECELNTSIHSDHKMISLGIEMDNFVRKPGTWKLNTEHLLNDEYKDGIAEILGKNLSKIPVS